jgi:glycosyltransferase involved in cell wall biosynthesis
MDVSSQPKILYITYDGLTDPLGQSQILPYLKGLSSGGYQFTILSFEKKDRFSREKKIIEDITREAGIEWVPLWFTSSPPFLSKFYDAVRMRAKAFQLQRAHHFDMVHCRSYVAADVGLALKQKFGIRFIFDMRGFWADEKVDNGQWDLRKLLFRKIYHHYKQKEQKFLLCANGIVSLTNGARMYLLKQTKFMNLIIDVIPCCADLRHFDYNKINAQESLFLKEKLEIPLNARVITYLGSVGGWYMTTEMFQFFKKLSETFPDFYLLVLTKDSPEQVKNEAVALGLTEDKLRVLYSSRMELPLYLSICDLSIFFIKNTFSKIASSPTKHAELMGMGLPVICNEIGDTGCIVEQTCTGYLVRNFEEKSLNEAVNQVPFLLHLEKEKIRKHAIQLFDLTIGVGKYHSLYKRVLKD